MRDEALAPLLVVARELGSRHGIACGDACDAFHQQRFAGSPLRRLEYVNRHRSPNHAADDGRHKEAQNVRPIMPPCEGEIGQPSAQEVDGLVYRHRRHGLVRSEIGARIRSVSLDVD